MPWFLAALLYGGLLLFLPNIQRLIMDKYSVEIPEDEKTKHSSQGECSSCGGKLDMNANPPRCPKCGYEPQERPPKEAT